MKKIFIYIFGISTLVLAISSQVFAGPDFPLVATSSREPTSIRVTLKNTTTVAYTARVALFMSTNATQTPPGGNDKPYVLIAPGTQKNFDFNNLQANTSYRAHLIATKDAQPNPSTSIFFEKDIVIASRTPNAPSVVCFAPQILQNGVCVTPSTTPTPDPVVQGGGGAQNNTATVAAGGATFTPQDNPNTPEAKVQADQCNDGIDNQKGDGKDYGYGVGNGDHKADHYGVDVLVDGKTDGVMDIEPDPSCFSDSVTTEKGDDVVSTIIPCTDKCTFSDVFRLLNNVIKFFFKVLLIPIFVVLLMFAGFKYITAQGNSSKIADLKKMLLGVIKGVVLILCAWLIVRTIMNTLLNDNFKQSGVELLGN